MDESMPLYAMVAEHLRKDINEEKIYGLLPSEADLTKLFSVSRSVIRQSLSLLEMEGLVHKVHGRGTFIVPKQRIHRIVQSLNGLGMQIEKIGIATKTEVLGYEIVDFNNSPDNWGSKQALKLLRLRYGYGSPLSLIETRLPPHVAKHISKQDLEDKSLHKQLSLLSNIDLVRSKRSILAIPASAMVASKLQVAVGTPLLLLEGVSYTADDNPVEVFSTYHRADRIAFDVETII